MAAATKNRALRASWRLGLAVLAGVLIAGGVLAGTRSAVHAEDVTLTGVLAPQDDGSVAFDDGLNTYSTVSAMDFTPFLGSTVQVLADAEGPTLYVRALTEGAISLTDQGGSVDIVTTGTVEQAEDGFQMTVEGITFTLVDSDELDQAVGKTADVEGQLIGSVISLTSLTF